MRSFSADFQGTERFQVKDHLGSGTSGEVYCVYDTQLRSYVALKTLQRADPAAIYRFKTEFRALTDVNHPNLAQLYELQLEGDRWFFTMELIDGWDFLEYVRGEPQVSHTQPPEPSPPPDFERLRDALHQLAVGLAALHRAGKLHCDIKPSNIRVDHQGRVVLLDFGLVQELFPGAGDMTVDAELTGTPAYMSPEQAAGQRLNEATDWYSVGVILYEALTGRRPFYGGFLQVLQSKQLKDPPPPSELLSGLPEDLDKLCMRLLDRNPANRLTGDKVVRELGREGDRALDSHRSSISGAGAPLLGREWHLATLAEGFERARRGQAIVVFVHGSSGMGKSALVDQFLKQVQDEHERTVILKGRCYERESVPYKALDALIDNLSRYLNRLDKNEAEALLPTNVQALARLFPALRRVQSVVRSQRRVLEIPDEREQKRRARGALRELLQRLAHRRPLILHIDDLHWGDRDSADLLSDILRPPDPPPLMLVGSFRSEEKDSSPLLQELHNSPLIREGAEVREITVEELSEDDAFLLARHLFGNRGASIENVARVIAQESAGSPYFVAELVRYAIHRSRTEDTSVNLEIDSAGMNLSRLIGARLSELSDEASRLLQVVAVAGQPVELQVAIQAAELGAAAQGAVTQLRAGSLIRIRRSRDFDEIEPYHTRIREAVFGAIDPTLRRRIHGALALALEGSERSDPETLAIHFREAGDADREARYTIAAADQSYEALAFDRASRLYRQALEQADKVDVPRHELMVKLGDALTNSGRGAEAAKAYLEAAPGAKTAEDALELRRRAAEQQLMSGHLVEGLDTMRQVLESVGMSMPRSPVAVLASLVFRRIQLTLQGLKFTERDTSQLSQETLLKIDACRAVATGLGNVDPLRGTLFATRHLLLALDAGEPYRVARAFAFEAGFSSAGGTQARKRTDRLLDLAMTMAERVNHPNAIGLSQLSAALTAYLAGEGSRAVELLDKAEEVLRESGTGVTWEIDSLIHYKYRLLIFLGQLKSVSSDLPALLKDFIERGDIYGESTLRSATGWFMRLVDDRPDQAREEIERSRSIWNQEGYHLQHYMQLVGAVEMALYRGDNLSAWAVLQEEWPHLVRSMLLQVVEITRSEALHLRCRGALAAAVTLGRDTPQGAKAFKTLRKVLRKLDKQPHPWSKPWARLVRAGLDTLLGEEQSALDHLVAAAAGFDNHQMGLYAAVARRRRGMLLGGDQGRRFIEEADRWMEGQGVKNPERMTDTLAPGVWG